MDDIRTLYLFLPDANKLAREIGVTTFGTFLSDSEDEPEEWFPIEDGLRTVRALAAAVKELSPPPDHWAYNIEHEFAALEGALVRAGPQAKEFALVIV
jgi:hypothetical protein